MVTSLIERRNRQPVTVLKYAPTLILTENRDEPAWTEQTPVLGVVSAISSTELTDVGQDLQNRRKIVRLFGAHEVGPRDKVVLAGETYEIDGVPNIARGVSGRTITTIYAVKAGENS